MKENFELLGYMFRQRFTTCGKKECKCQNGEKHGPYWYASETGETPKYVGRELPDDVVELLINLEREKEKLNEMRELLVFKRDEALAHYHEMNRGVRSIGNLQNGRRPDMREIERLGFGHLKFEL